MGYAIDARIGINLSGKEPFEIDTSDSLGNYYPVIRKYPDRGFMCLDLGCNAVLWFDIEYARDLCGCLAKIDDLICTLKLAEGGKDGD